MARINPVHPPGDGNGVIFDRDWVPDRERASGPWRQLLQDLNASAPVSHWASEVTTARVQSYDQIRVYVTRGLLLVAVIVLLLLAPGTCWLTWVLLMPAFLQVIGEVAVHMATSGSDPSQGGLVGVMARIAADAHAYSLVNVTGVLGVVAVPAVIVSTAYTTGPGEPAWVKVLALAGGAAYGVSAILSLLTDATNYSLHQPSTLPYRLFRIVRPHLWLIVCAAMTGLVAGSVAARRWAPMMEPLAWALCVMPVFIGMKQRDYERFLRASGELLPDVQASAKRMLSKDYHNTNTSIRTFTRDVAANKDVPADIRVKAAALAPLISMMREAADHENWVNQHSRASLAAIATKCASDAGLDAVVDVRLDDLDTANYELARALIAALTANVGQALTRARREGGAVNESASAEIEISGEVRGPDLHICIRDPLPLIAHWCHEGSTTLWLHEELIQHGGTGLSQRLDDPDKPQAGKVIEASWPVKRPATRLWDVHR